MPSFFFPCASSSRLLYHSTVIFQKEKSAAIERPSQPPPRGDVTGLPPPLFGAHLPRTAAPQPRPRRPGRSYSGGPVRGIRKVGLRSSRIRPRRASPVFSPPALLSYLLHGRHRAVPALDVRPGRTKEGRPTFPGPTWSFRRRGKGRAPLAPGHAVLGGASTTVLHARGRGATAYGMLPRDVSCEAGSRDELTVAA